MTRAHWSLLRRYVRDELDMMDWDSKDRYSEGYRMALDRIHDKMSAIVRANKRRQVKRA